MTVDKNPKLIGSLFDRIATSYDTLNTILSLGIDRLWRAKTIRSLDIHGNHLVLDIATGTGEMALRALGRDNCRVVGIDFSWNMLARARVKQARQNRDAHFFLIRGDALVMPFGDMTFDRAVISFGVRNVIDAGMFLSEAWRVLKKGGRMAVLEFSLPEVNPFKNLYLLYFSKVIPFLGGVISGDFAAYRYLRDSVIDFIPPRELERMMGRAGFAVVLSRPILFGVTHLYVLEKQ